MDIKVPSQQPSVIPTRIAFIAEAPSDEEETTLVPLTGPAGRVFNAMLRSANLDRDEFFVGNVFNTRAPDNDVEKAGWFRDEPRITENFQRLNEELTAVKPTVIVPLGGTALWAFTGEKLIAKYRGSVTKASRIMPGHKLLPTFHPSAVQRRWDLLPIVTGDFIKAAHEADLGPGFVYPKVELMIEPTLADIAAFVGECKASPKLSVDIETGWGQITSIAFAPSTSRALAIPFVDLRRPNKSYWPTLDDEVAAWLMVKEILEAPCPKVGQNFMYDLFWLWRRKGIVVRNYRFDTRLRHKTLYPELGADLASMAGSYTRIGAWKTWSGRYNKETAKKDG